MMTKNVLRSFPLEHSTNKPRFARWSSFGSLAILTLSLAAQIASAERYVYQGRCKEYPNTFGLQLVLTGPPGGPYTLTGSNGSGFPGLGWILTGTWTPGGGFAAYYSAISPSFRGVVYEGPIMGGLTGTLGAAGSEFMVTIAMFPVTDTTPPRLAFVSFDLALAGGAPPPPPPVRVPPPPPPPPPAPAQQENFTGTAWYGNMELLVNLTETPNPNPPPPTEWKGTVEVKKYNAQGQLILDIVLNVTGIIDPNRGPGFILSLTGPPGTTTPTSECDLTILPNNPNHIACNLIDVPFLTSCSGQFNNFWPVYLKKK